MKTIGEEMREARMRAGLTVREVGHRVNAGESQISTWENGHVNPRPAARAAYVNAELLTAEQGHAPFEITENDAA